MKTRFILIFALILTLLSLPSFAKTTEGTGGEVQDAASFLSAIGGDDAGWINKAGEVCLKSDVTLTGAVNIKGGEITLNGASCMLIRGFDGGALFNIDGGSLIIGNPKNTDKDETIIFDGGGKDGQAFEVSSGSLSIHNGALVEGFKSSGNGGAFSISGGEMNILGGIIRLCSASNGGGAYVNGGKLAMSGGQIMLCEAANSGGGVYVESGAFELTGGTVGGEIIHDEYSTDATVKEDDGNKAQKGGGIYFTDASQSFVNGGIVSANIANEGGGIFNAEGSALLLAAGTVSYNKADTNGGGIYNIGEVLCGYAELSYNKATEKGGGLYNIAGIYTMQNGLLNSNEARYGAGIYNESDSSFEILDGSANYNTASVTGGGAYNVEGGKLKISGGSFGYNKISGESKLGVDIYSEGELIFANAVFIGGDNDVALGRLSDGSAAVINLEPPFTCTTTIARLRPVTKDESGAIINDYDKRNALVVANGDISEYVHLFKVMTDETGGAWRVGKDGGIERDIPIVWIITGAVVIAAVIGGAVFAVKIRKRDKKA